MKEIVLTQGKVALVDDEDYEYLLQWKWCCPSGRYAYNSSMGYMHRVIMNTPKCVTTDHRDYNTLNNQKYNLRSCTHSQNMQRMQCSKNKFRGVWWNTKAKKFECGICVETKTIYLGLFSDEVEAAKVYNKAALQYFGADAAFNIIS